MRANAISPRAGGRVEAVVLVVDDDDLVVRALTRILVRARYQVASATSIVAAKAALASTPNLVAAIVDLNLGNEDGQVLVTHLVDHHPELMVIVLSGAVVEGQVTSQVHYLAKPASLAQIVRLLGARTDV
jgi:two-component system response regulator RegA